MLCPMDLIVSHVYSAPHGLPENARHEFARQKKGGFWSHVPDVYILKCCVVIEKIYIYVVTD